MLEEKSYVVMLLLFVCLLLLSSCGVDQTGWLLKLPNHHSNLNLIEADAQHYYLAINGLGVVSVSRMNGEIVWQFPSDDQSSQGSLFHNDYPVTIALDKDILYVGNGNLIYSLSTETGSLLWQLDLGEPIETRAEMIVTPDMFLVVSSISNTVYAIERTSGEMYWNFIPMVPSEQTALPVCSSAERVSLLVGQLSLDSDPLLLSEAQLLVISTESGDLLWNADLQALTKYPDMLVPAVVDSENYIYVAGSHMVAMFNGETGEMEWIEHVTGSFNNLTLLQGELVATGPLFVTRISLDSGEPLCSEFERWGGQFLEQINDRLYYTDHRLEWKSGDLVYKSSFYSLEPASCSPHLETSLDGRLVMYDPIAKTGLIVADRSDNWITLHTVTISPQ